MAQISESSKGGKRSLNSDLNLVSFIDLLSVCICFLLIAAAWLQVGDVEVKQALGTDASEAEPKVEILATLKGPAHVTLTFKKNQTELASFEVKDIPEESLQADVFQKVQEQIAKLKSDPAQQVSDVVSSATITPSADAPYKTLVYVMDALRRNQVVNLGVVPI